ncbi:MAG TPA: hypothetical protein VMG82_15480 [Candidatus Sulfotelmatobacter sp.]|nr:hypothetical protein [Candidatus Sulfotelmatobacter sp.]
MKSNALSRMQREGSPSTADKLARLLLVVFFMCSLLAASASAAPFVYVVTLSQQFGTVDLANGQFTPIGSPTPDGTSNLVWWNGSLLSLATTGANAGYLVRINPATGNETVLRAITYNGQPLGFNGFDLAKVNGGLYVTDFSNNLYAVDFATGNARLVGRNGGTTGLRPDPNIPFTFNSDGTFNLCDEGLYGFEGKLYATFDSYAIDPTQTPPTRAHEYMSPYLWQIDPRTGAATFIANTDWQLSAIVAVNGKFYAFEAVLDAFDFDHGVPIAHAELVTLDLRTGKTSKVADVVSNQGPIFGAAPVR